MRVLWVSISTQANSEIGIVIPLEYRNIPSQLEAIGVTTNTVEVRLRGPAALIREISPRDISATVDLSGLRSGEKIVNLTPQNVRSPFGVDIVRVSPSQVKLNLERKGHSGWIDTDRLMPGIEWREEIDKTITDCIAVMAIMSPEARASEYVTYEWAFARGAGKTIIPLMLRQTSLHPRLATLQYLDFSNRMNRPWDRLYQSL